MKKGFALPAALLLGLALGGCSKEDPQGFPKVDYNKDGRVIFEELIVVFPDLTVEEFLAADADRSGALSDAEYQRFHQARQAGKKLDASSAPPAPAAPAPASKTSEPAKTPETAPSPPPAAPAAPAAPVSQDAPPAAPEAVETVEVGPAAPAAPAAPGTGTGQTYTVVRGDSLARIAKKFDLSAQAIMAANGLKNADQLQAGATLTIPPAGGGAVAAPPAVTRFVAGVFAKNVNGDINGLLDAYGETVDYYKKGKSGKDVVRQDKADYFGRWPERTYTPGAATVETLGNGDLRVTVPTAFTAKKGDRGVAGKATFTFVLRPAGETFRIVGEQSVVTEKK